MGGWRLGGAGPVLVTAIEVLGLPLDWRTKLELHAAIRQAAFHRSNRSDPPHISPTYRAVEHCGSVWMLPEICVGWRECGPQLQLTYSLTLLNRRPPTTVDGKRHALPGIGWCSAGIDEPGNRVEVDCFSAITHPAQVSRHGSTTFRQPASTTTSTLYPVGAATVQPAHEARHPPDASRETPNCVHRDGMGGGGPSGEVSDLAWHSGQHAEACPLPTERKDFQQARWRDVASHEHSLTVDQGVQLEVLDFGGTDSPLLLGLGATAAR